jgi:4,5-dihydroxyphthalate decarboxylase
VPGAGAAAGWILPPKTGSLRPERDDRHVPKKLPITLACGDYEIVRALKEGAVEPDGIELNILTDMDSTTRHWRFLRNREFDMAETSCSSYIVARDQGLPFDALPVFLHRRFRHGFVFINTTKGIAKPTDLIGRRVGVKSYLVTAGHWMRGILEHEYGVPHRSIEWFAEIDEDVDFTPPAELNIHRVEQDKSVEDMLAEGELDALIHADIIKPIAAGDPRVGRLWPDYKSEEMRYYRKTGIFPIMHVMGIRPEIVERYPWVPINMFQAFDKAKAIAMRRLNNPRIVPLAWYREAWEEQEKILGPDPWEYGLTDRNRHTLETIAGYSYEQGLTRRRMAADELFVSVFQGRKRGDEFRI